MSLARTANDFLRDEASKLQAKLQESEQKLQRYKEEQNAVSLEDTQNITVAKLKDLSSQVTQANSERINSSPIWSSCVRSLPTMSTECCKSQCQRDFSGTGAAFPD